MVGFRPPKLHADLVYVVRPIGGLEELSPNDDHRDIPPTPDHRRIGAEAEFLALEAASQFPRRSQSTSGSAVNVQNSVRKNDTSHGRVHS